MRIPLLYLPIGVMLCQMTGGDAEAAVRAVPFARLTASAEQPPKYGVAQAADGRAATHWAAGNSPPVWIRGEFDRPEWISRVRLLQCESTRIYDNARRIAITFSDGSTVACTLGDRWQEQAIAFARRKAAWLRITIESTHKTSHYVGISELIAEDEGPAAESRPGVAVSPPAPDGRKPAQPAASPAPRRGSTKTAPVGAGDVADPAALVARLSPDPPSAPQHPTLWMNHADVARAKANIRKHAWARRVFRDILQESDRWLGMSDDQLRAIVPKKGACFDHPANCPACGAACQASLERIGQAFCPGCRKAYPDATHPDDGRGWKNPGTGKVTHFVGLYNEAAVDRITDGAGDLSHAYVLTRDPRYARALSILLDSLAVIYPTCDTGPIWYPGVGGRLNRPFYQTARTLIYYAREYDLTHDSPLWDQPSCDPQAGTRRANYEKNLLLNGAQYCFDAIVKQKSPGLHNGNCDYLQGALAVGRVLGVQKFIDCNLQTDLSIFNFIENTVDRDGQYYETSFSYSHWATELFGHHAEMLRNYRSPQYPDGVDLYALPKLRQNYLRADTDVDCAGHQPALGDAGPDLAVLREDGRSAFSPQVYERLEVLAARTVDPQQRLRLQQQLYAYCGGDVENCRGRSARARWLLFHADDLPSAARIGRAAARSSGSTLLPSGRGIAILRAGSPGPDQACALLRYGATLNHGSPDEMNVNFYALGREITFDQGYGWAHHRAGWAHSTVAHNLVVVDERNQLTGGVGSGGSLLQFCQSPTIRVVAAADPAAYSAQGVRQYRRLVALVDLAPDRSYLLDVFDVAGGAKHDLSWHFAGDLDRVTGLTLGAPQKSGSLAGPQYEWWKQIQVTGWLTGQNKGFYWNAPPENGYGFLYDVQQSEPTATPPVLTWKLGQRELTRPAGACAAEQCLAAASVTGSASTAPGRFLVPLAKPGDFATFRITVPSAGDYLAMARISRLPNAGTVALTVDGKPVGQPWNAYSPVEYAADPAVFGRVALQAGPHDLRLECVGKDADSAGFALSLSYVALVAPGDLESLGRKHTEGIALRLIPPPESRIVLAKAKGLARAPVASYVLTRRSGKDLASRFVSVVEPFCGVPQVQGAATVPAEGKTRCSPSVTVVKSAGGRADYFFDCPESGQSPISAAADAKLPLRFTGQFAAVRTQSGRLVEVLLYKASQLTFGQSQIETAQPVCAGKVRSVNYQKGLVTVDLPMAARNAAESELVYFSREGYSRAAPYLLGAVRPSTEGAVLDLRGASLVLAGGRLTSDVSPQGVFSNGVPLDREKAFGRRVRTRYFDGKSIRNLRTGELGRIRHVELDASVALDVNPGLRRGDRFELLDVQAGDTFAIPGCVALVQSEPGNWLLRANVPVQITLPGAAVVQVAARDATPRRLPELPSIGGRHAWRFDPGE